MYTYIQLEWRPPGVPTGANTHSPPICITITTIAITIICIMFVLITVVIIIALLLRPVRLLRVSISEGLSQANS